tara:strand:+ start:268 stop:552 length:285 start_codon:yes stop_codon:yes gene_type:complete
MKNITRHYGILKLIERMDNSINGNPRFELAVMDPNGKGLGWSFRTRNDDIINYMLEGWLDQPVEVEIGTHYGKPTCNWLKPLTENQFNKILETL